MYYQSLSFLSLQNRHTVDLKFAFESISRKLLPLKTRMISFLFIIISNALCPSLISRIESGFLSFDKINKKELMLTPQLPAPSCELKPLIWPDLKRRMCKSSLPDVFGGLFLFSFASSSFHPTSTLKALIWREPHGITDVLLLFQLFWMLLTGSSLVVFCWNPCSCSPFLSPLTTQGSLSFAPLHTTL